MCRWALRELFVTLLEGVPAIRAGLSFVNGDRPEWQDKKREARRCQASPGSPYFVRASITGKET